MSAIEISRYFSENNLEKRSTERKGNIGQYLRLDYSNELYRTEAIESTPIFTESREKIYNNNVILATDNLPNSNEHARTVTTKQDRHPNSGIIEYKNIVLTDTNNKYRNLTPRECFLLMGFKEEQYQLLIENNLEIGESRKFLSQTKLIQLAGNSIVVQVLESIFKQFHEINEMFFKDKPQRDTKKKELISAV